MSINLTLVFDRYGFAGPILAYERYRLDWRDYEAFDRIKAEAVPLSHGIHWYGDEGLEDRTDDEYGAPLTWLPAHSVARHLASAPLRGWDLATLSFLKALPPGTRVVLMWS